MHASEQNDIIYGVRCHINFYLCCMFSHFLLSDYAARVRQLAQPARNVNSIGSRIASRHSVSTAIAIRRQSWCKRSLSLLEYYCKRDNFFYLLLLRFYKHSGRSATAFADRVGVAPFWVTLSSLYARWDRQTESEQQTDASRLPLDAASETVGKYT